jgi:hypothetical protein
MAIITAIPSLEVTILVDGKPLPEYEVSDQSVLKESDASQDASKVALETRAKTPQSFSVKYIEALSGKKPIISMRKEKGFKHNGHHLGVSVRFDEDNFVITHEPDEALEEDWEFELSGLLEFSERSGWTKRRFIFQPIIDYFAKNLYRVLTRHSR